MKQWIIPAIFVFSLCVSIAIAGSVSELAGIWIALVLPVSAWYLVERRRATKLLFAAVVLIALIAVAFSVPLLGVVKLGGDTVVGEHVGLKKFSSYDELEKFVKTNLEKYYGNIPKDMLIVVTPTVTTPPAPNGESDFRFTMGDSIDFSTTNIQVEGVDEADIVKCDGKYLYVVSGNKVVIIYAYPPENARVLSEIQGDENSCVNDIFIKGDKLVVLGWDFAKVYDISDKENPALKREVSFDGYYFNSRMIGDYVYLIASSPEVYVWKEEKIDLPEISCNGNMRTVPATEIYYFENLCDFAYQYTTIMAINTQNDEEEITSETFLMTPAQTLFVSSNNIYITYTNYWIYPEDGSNGTTHEMEKTIIHKITIAGGKIEYRSQGEVPGCILNQFSMDEYQGCFRIATTTGWYGANHVYVLDQDLNIIGRLENLAPGERIYSARFMGGRAYLVTFKQVDPLFVIDLADPTDPKILGKLKIPGYSDYLHPYDETHLIGVGKDTVESDEGDFALYQGVKIALFDVSDPENPVEISKYVVGQRGTESLALQDHRAFLFSRSKNLLVMPIGDWGQQDAYVFDISLDGGIIFRGSMTHCENEEWRRSGWYSVKRSLYIKEVLYTVSSGLIKMNDLADLSELGSVQLSPPAEWNWDYYPMIK